VAFLEDRIGCEGEISSEIIIIDYGTEDPVKSIETIAHWVRLQGSALVRYRLRAAHGW